MVLVTCFVVGGFVVSLVVSLFFGLILFGVLRYMD